MLKGLVSCLELCLVLKSHHCHNNTMSTSKKPGQAHTHYCASHIPTIVTMGSHYTGHYLTPCGAFGPPTQGPCVFERSSPSDLRAIGFWVMPLNVALLVLMSVEYDIPNNFASELL